MDKNKIAIAASAESLVAQTKALELEMYCHDQIVRALTKVVYAQGYQENATQAEVDDEPDTPSSTIAARAYLLLLTDKIAVPSPSSRA